MFQGPKGNLVQMCEVHLQYGNSTTKWPFYTFSSKFLSNIYSILFAYNPANALCPCYSILYSNSKFPSSDARSMTISDLQ